MRLHRSRFAIVVLGVALLAALALDVVLFVQGRRYYLELNDVRLDPIGLRAFASATEPASTEKPTAVFFGDSRAADWPTPDEPRFEFVNRGIGAQTSAQSLLRFDAHVALLRPRLIIVQVGVNDLKTVALFPERRQAIVDDCLANIKQIVTRSTQLGATVILTTIFPVGEVPLARKPFWSPDVAAAVSEVNVALRPLAAPNVIVFDAYAILAGADGSLQTQYAQDELHLNPAGYAALNAELERVLAGLQ